ncbi:MAG: hypothetical protein KJ906_00565 [Nanoarchaeota archaeon]|nr:hypothetical protein [Nanoarchaeota archaeon]
MVDKLEAEYSERYLYGIFSKLKVDEQKHIGLMGGWAVQFLLEKFGIKHIGSRDIDIFFDPDKISIERIKDIIESEGFVPHSTFRWCKYIDRNTGKELTETETGGYQTYDLVYIFVDVLTPKDIGRFFYEPLLKEVFNGEMATHRLKNLEIMIPSTKIMIELKAKTVCERKERDKREKDVADLFSLINNCKESWELDSKGNIISIVGIRDEIRKSFRDKLNEIIVDGTIASACQLIKLKNVDAMINMLKFI